MTRPATVLTKAKRCEVARVMVLSPRQLGALQVAQALGLPLTCRLESSTLVVEVAK